jgi:peptidoglycan/LPS O-acetylase OafA/YrhL
MAKIATIIPDKIRKAPAVTGSYRPEIDGLRALAVLSVMMYHAEIRFFSVGYLGVDIFFAISGFLITGIIVSSSAPDQADHSGIDCHVPDYSLVRSPADDSG